MKSIMKPYVIAHRGASGNYPENTLLAFQQAIEVGTDWIELDVMTTSDDVVIVSHDARADRCTNGTGYIPAMTLEQVKQLDAGIRSGEAFAGERIPTLHEALDCIGNKARVCIEIKGDTTDDHLRHARFTVDVLERRGNLRHVVISSFNPDCLRAIKTWQPLLVTSLDPDRQDGTYSAWQLCEKVLACGANFLLHRHETLTPEIINECHQHGFSLWTWTVNEEATMRRAINMGVDAIMTDYSSLLRKIVDRSTH